MSEPDDLQWLDALSGKPPATAKTPAEREARMLREAILQHSQAEAPVDLADEHTRQAQLLERAHREGLLSSRSVPAPAPGSRTGRSRALLRMSLAAGLVGLAIIAASVWSPTRPPEVVRGPEGIFHLQAQDPQQLKRQILGDLQAAGIMATGYEALGAEGIDADLPTPLTTPVQDVLQKYGIPTPTDGTLRVEIRAKRSQ